MKFRPFSIIIGIAQAIAVFVFLWLEMFLLDAFVDDWTMTVNLSITIGVISLFVCTIIILAYPIYLFRKQQQADGFVVLTSTVISVAIFLGFLFFMANQLFGGID